MSVIQATDEVICYSSPERQIQLPTPEMAALHLDVIFPLRKKIWGAGSRQELETGWEVAGYNIGRTLGREELHLSIT